VKARRVTGTSKEVQTWNEEKDSYGYKKYKTVQRRDTTKDGIDSHRIDRNWKADHRHYDGDKEGRECRKSRPVLLTLA